jgi:hypothetical protein
MKKKGESGSTFEVKTTDKVRTQHKCPDGKAVELWVYKIDKTKVCYWGKYSNNPQWIRIWLIFPVVLFARAAFSSR